jgi:hypothetical protein
VRQDSVRRGSDGQQVQEVPAGNVQLTKIPCLRLGHFDAAHATNTQVYMEEIRTGILLRGVTTVCCRIVTVVDFVLSTIIVVVLVVVIVLCVCTCV